MARIIACSQGDRLLGMPVAATEATKKAHRGSLCARSFSHSLILSHFFLVSTIGIASSTSAIGLSAPRLEEEFNLDRLQRGVLDYEVGTVPSPWGTIISTG